MLRILPLRHALRTAAPAILAAAVGICGPVRVAAADDYPTHAAQIIVSLPAGSGTDILARIMGQAFAAKFDKPFLVVNRPGADLTIAMGAVAGAAADGHTIAFSPVTPIVIQPQRRKDLPYTRDSFVPVCQTFENVFYIGVGPKSQFQDIQSLLAYAKANPGKLRYGHSGVAGGPHLAGAEFWRKAGVQLTDIPYPGEPAYAPHLVSGELDIGIVTTNLVISQRLTPLAVFSAEREKAYPNVPTGGELGFPVTSVSYGGLLVRAGTAPAIIATLESACREVVNSPAYQEMAAKQRARVHYLDRNGFAGRIDADIRSVATILRELKLQE
jgi:tripartite-type tricarboxylate transporter receptor subunit TctC